MASYRLVFKRSVARDLRAIPNAEVTRILKRIESLAGDPRPLGCEKLSARECYRIRQGAYRIVYEIADQQGARGHVLICHMRVQGALVLWPGQSRPGVPATVPCAMCSMRTALHSTAADPRTAASS